VARLYTDENVPLPVVEGLRQLGHDVLTTLEAGKAGLAEPDEAVLAFATAASRVLVTLNRKHFIRLHGEQPEHAGILVCSFDANFLGLAQRIHGAIESSGDLRRELLRVDRP
jgi:hypothetical protein